MHLMRQGWCIGLRLPVQLRANNHKKRNSELISTLECYLSNKQSIRKTSELMNVHPRTVSYRLSKIVDLTGIEFDNSAEILAVRNGIIILKILEQL